MQLKIIIAALALILVSCFACEAGTSVKAEVDNTNITTDDTITYKLTISSSENKTPQLQLPKFEGFFVLSQAQSSTISYAKNNLETLFVYVFILAPNEAGKFKIEPCQITLQGKAYSTDSFEIVVTQGKAKEKRQEPKKVLPVPKDSLPESEEPQVTL